MERTWKKAMALVLATLLLAQPALLFAQQGQGQGQATDEIERWKTIIQDNSERIRDVEQSILDLRTVFGDEAGKLKAALAKFRQDPKGQRRDLQGATADSLERIAGVTGEILSHREETILGAMEIERKSREKATDYRAQSESLDKTLPTRQSKLAEIKAKNDQLKDQYAEKPRDRGLERQLRESYREEVRLQLGIQNDQRRTRLLAAAGTKLEQAAEKIQRLADGLDATLDNIELVQLDCQNNAKLLKELKTVEEEIDAFTGGAEVGTLLTQVGEMTDLTEELSRTVGLAMEAFLEPQVEKDGGGPPKIPDSGFDRWLNAFPKIAVQRAGPAEFGWRPRQLWSLRPNSSHAGQLLRVREPRSRTGAVNASAGHGTTTGRSTSTDLGCWAPTGPACLDLCE